MTIDVRSATLSDLESLTSLLVLDAKERYAIDPILWALDKSPHDKVAETVKAAMEAENPPFRQNWLIAEAGGEIVGVAHSILLPVPPIYAGEFGPPGLIMEDCYVTASAPNETRSALVSAAEADLDDAGAKIMLGSSIQGGFWEAEYFRHGYEPLTMYFARTGLRQSRSSKNLRNATEKDVPSIVALSATHRSILSDLNGLFWKPHKEANSRFGSWMTRSLTLPDRNMYVSESDGAVRGYAISQPATPLHFPTPHDISGVGVIDDFFHEAIGNPAFLSSAKDDALALFKWAEAARKERSNEAIIVVCPAAWASKIELLESTGYENAITWFFKKID